MQEINRMYNGFRDVFSATLELRAPLITNFLTERKIAEKFWLTKEMRDEITIKHRFFNIWNKIASEEVHISLKYQRNLVNKHLKKDQTSSANKFSVNYQPLKNNGSSSRRILAKKRMSHYRQTSWWYKRNRKWTWYCKLCQQLVFEN